MRGHGKPTPTCLYYEHKECARPKDCPTHGPILDRPKKKHHLLRAELEGLAPGKATYHRTLCGIWLHKRLEYGVGPNTAWEMAKGDHKKMFDIRQEVELSGFRIRLPPSTDQSYEIFLEVGHSHKEVLCLTQQNTVTITCKRCSFQFCEGVGHKFPEKIWDKTLFEEFMVKLHD